MIHEITAALERLGSDADEIAVTLANKGIVGYRRAPRRCPLAKYLETQFPDASIVSVGLWARVGNESVSLSPACRNFISRFDHDKYLDLCCDDSALQ